MQEYALIFFLMLLNLCVMHAVFFPLGTVEQLKTNCCLYIFVDNQNMYLLFWIKLICLYYFGMLKDPTLFEWRKRLVHLNNFPLHAIKCNVHDTYRNKNIVYKYNNSGMVLNRTVSKVVFNLHVIEVINIFIRIGVSLFTT